MVKRLLPAMSIFVLLGTTQAQAQDSTATRPPRDSAVRNQHKRWPDEPRRVAMIGPMAGVNFAKFGGDDVSGVDSRTGFQLGLFGSFPLGKFVALQPSVAYSQQGTSLDPGGGVTLKFKLNYIEAPVLLRFSAPLQTTSQMRPYFELGPAIAIEASCNVEGSDGSQSATLSCDDDQLQLQRKKTTFSAHFGAGIEFDRFFLGARYQLGLSSIDDTGGDIKNRVIAIMAGYGFRLGH